MNRRIMLIAVLGILGVLGLLGLGGAALAAFPPSEAGGAAAGPPPGPPRRGAAPDVYGGADVIVNNWAADFYPNLTQSGSTVWGNGNTVIVNFNSTSGVGGPLHSVAGLARSTDGGATFQEKSPSPFANGRGYIQGSPTVLYSARDLKWYASTLAIGCGTHGVRFWSSSNDGVTWQSGTCAYSGEDATYQSHWVDNNPASPYYGWQYISVNDTINVTAKYLQVNYSSDGGASWRPTPITLYTGTTVVQNVQITGDSNGTLFVVALDENGGPNARRNRIYRSTDGGATWPSSYTSPAFPAPGDGSCGGNGIAPFWLYTGGGQMGVGPGLVLHYVYTQGTGGGDPGDIYYIRSTDSGTTWAIPLRLNTDTTQRAQWLPALSVTATGDVLAGWYDRRGTTNNDYEYWGRRSTDNGVTWQPDMPVSDPAPIPQPQQPDPAMLPCSVETFNYAAANGNTHYLLWTDGRNRLPNGRGILIPQQDLYFDRVPPSGATPTPTAGPPLPTPDLCVGNYQIAQGAGATVVAGTTDTGNHCDDCVSTVALPFVYTLYDHPYTAANVSSNGTLQFVGNNPAYLNNCLPDAGFPDTIFAHWDDQRTDISGTLSSGIFTSISGSAPNRIFNIEWRTVYYGSTVSLDYEVRLYEGQTRFDVIYGMMPRLGTSATSGVQRAGGGRVTQFACNIGGLPGGLILTYTLTTPCAGGSPTATRTPRPVTPLPTRTPRTPVPCATIAGRYGWQDCEALPLPVERGSGAVNQLPTAAAAAPDHFHALTRFSSMGGDTQDTNSLPPGFGPGQSTPVADTFEYVPITNVWSLQNSYLINDLTQDMVAGALDVGGSPEIFLVGGGGAGSPSVTNMVRMYDPLANTLTLLPPEDWWPVANTLPGGGAVVSNTLYIFGGYQLNSGPINQIWAFDPNAAPGVRWTQVPLTLPTPLAYIPAAAISDTIYLAGGAVAAGPPGAFADSKFAYVFRPLLPTPTIQSIAQLLVATSHTQAVPVGQEIWVLGGGITAPGPYNIVQIYNPVNNNWRMGPRFHMPRRDAAIAVALGHMIFMAGGTTPYGITDKTENFFIELPDGTPLPTPSVTPVVPPTPCAIQFIDVDPNNPFYVYIRCLVCRQIVSGYSDGTFRWGVNVNRGQLAKIIALAAGLDDPVPLAQQDLADIPPTNPFWLWIEQLYGHGILSGYTCGGPGEPCDAANRPYFRPGANATRGQISKIDAVAANLGDAIPTTRQSFEDVPSSNPFWLWIEQLAGRGIISGYTCGGPGEPCIPPGNRPYFRWGASTTRGQLAKIAANTFFPNCQTPVGR